MSIRITRNENGNCITFIGSSQPAYWNSCLSGQVNSEDATRINVVNDVRTTDSANPVYEFFGVPYTEFQDKDGSSFADSATTAAYITAQANVVSGGTVQFGATDAISFSRDNTNTSILTSIGNNYGVNSIVAVGEADGTISINENVAGGSTLIKSIRSAYVTVSGQTQAQTLSSVVNSLNALFSVTPVGGGADDIFASYTYSNGSATMLPFGDVTVAGTSATKGTNTGSNVNDGVYSTTRPISDNGEYFEFNNTGNDYKRKFVIGLKLTSEITSDAVLVDNTTVGEDMALAVRLKANATYEHSPYGAVIENGFYSNPQKSTLYRAGIDTDGRLFVSHFDEDDQAWQVIVRSALITGNEEYSLVLFLNEDNSVVTTTVDSKKIVDGSIVLNYRYIESPDGEFYYPLFSTEAEANYKDELGGFAGTSHSHIFVDELPSANTWYMPSNGGTQAGASAPTNSAGITYSEINTGADSNYAPPAFTVADLTVNENTAINYQVSTTGDWTTTITGLMTPLTLSGNNIIGTTQEVTGYANVSPSIVQTATVTKTNAFGSTSTSFDIMVVNTTVNTNPITGFTHLTGSTAMVDSDTLGDGGAVSFDNLLDDGNRFHISKEFIDATLIPATPNAGDTIYIGIPVASPNWGSITKDDFVFCWKFQRDTQGSRYKIYRTGLGLSDSYGIWLISGSSLLYDFYISNKGGVLELTGDQYQFVKDNEPTVTDGGAWSISRVLTGQATESKTLVMAAVSCTPDITLTNLSEYALPSTSTLLTNWDKAIASDQYHEYMSANNSGDLYNPWSQTASSSSPQSYVQSGKVSTSANSRPWAMATVVYMEETKPCVIFGTHGSNNGGVSMNSGSAQTPVDKIDFFFGQRDLYNTSYGTGDNGVYFRFDKPVTGWYGYYIDHNGYRETAASVTLANVSNAFRIKQVDLSTGTVTDVVGTWALAGTGDMMIYMRNRKYYLGKAGSTSANPSNSLIKHASFVASLLDNGSNLPNDARISMMVRDPMQYRLDYFVGGSFAFFDRGSGSFAYSSYAQYQLHTWLFGDGQNDSFPNIKLAGGFSTSFQLSLYNYNVTSFETVVIPGLT